MKAPWQKKLQERIADFELDEPAGLWEAIEERRKAAPLPVAPSPAHNPAVRILLPALRIRTVAAAVALLVAFGGLMLLLAGSGDSTETGPDAVYARTEPTAATDCRQPEAATADNIAYDAPTAHTPGLHTPAIAGHAIENTGNHVSPTGASPSGQPRQSADTATPTVGDSLPPTPASARPQPDPDNTATKPRKAVDNGYNDNYRNYASANRDRVRKLTFGLYASGGNAASINRTSSPQPAAVPGAGPGNCSWNDNPMLGILLFNRGSELTTSIKHRQPVRFGLSVRYDITDRLGIESGLTYTKLDSDTREGSEKHYFLGNRTLHYIGLPLNLKYRLLSWKFIDLYASAGGMVEKCVSASHTRHYVIESVMTSSETDHFKVRPLQWSLNAAAGVQFRLTKFMGLYAEPGLSYYFDDGSDIRTIYKEKPLNFNLNLGLRFNFGE